MKGYQVIHSKPLLVLSSSGKAYLYPGDNRYFPKEIIGPLKSPLVESLRPEIWVLNFKKR